MESDKVENGTLLINREGDNWGVRNGSSKGLVVLGPTVSMDGVCQDHRQKYPKEEPHRAKDGDPGNKAFFARLGDRGNVLRLRAQ